MCFMGIQGGRLAWQAQLIERSLDENQISNIE
jgi:hypothetical protein